MTGESLSKTNNHYGFLKAETCPPSGLLRKETTLFGSDMRQPRTRTGQRRLVQTNKLRKKWPEQQNCAPVHFNTFPKRTKMSQYYRYTKPCVLVSKYGPR